MRLITITRDHPLRRVAEAFIRQTYLAHHGAHSVRIPRMLIAIADERGRIDCVAGLRGCEEGFFSQHYLDAPAEDIISNLAGTPVKRSGIVEVTGFASRSPAVSPRFVDELVRYGEALGFNWALFTATRRLGALLRRMKLPLIELAAASASRVPDAPAWGGYYDADPRVFVIGRESLTPFLARRDGKPLQRGVPVHE